MSTTNDKFKSDKVVNLGEYHRGFTPLDQFNFHHELEASRGASVVLFSKPGCSSCRAWKRLLLNYQKKNLKVALYEVDIEQDPSLAHEFELFHLPALYLYADGQFHRELQCEASLQTLQDEITAALQAPAQDLP